MPELGSRVGIHFWGSAGVTVIYQRERHAVKIVESMAQWVMAVVCAGFTVHALVPFS